MSLRKSLLFKLLMLHSFLVPLFLARACFYSTTLQRWQSRLSIPIHSAFVSTRFHSLRDFATVTRTLRHNNALSTLHLTSTSAFWYRNSSCQLAITRPVTQHLHVLITYHCTIELGFWLRRPLWRAPTLIGALFEHLAHTGIHDVLILLHGVGFYSDFDHQEAA